MSQQPTWYVSFPHSSLEDPEYPVFALVLTGRRVSWPGSVPLWHTRQSPPCYLHVEQQSSKNAGRVSHFTSRKIYREQRDAHRSPSRAWWHPLWTLDWKDHCLGTCSSFSLWLPSISSSCYLDWTQRRGREWRVVLFPSVMVTVTKLGILRCNICSPLYTFRHSIVHRSLIKWWSFSLSSLYIFLINCHLLHMYRLKVPLIAIYTYAIQHCLCIIFTSKLKP